MTLDKQTLIQRFEASVARFRGSRAVRLFRHPWTTIKASVIWRIVHTVLGGRFVMDVQAKTFFNKKLLVTIPPAYDLWVSGLYLDASEVRLIRFLLGELDAGDKLFDVGANFGYFSMLSAELVGSGGQVYAFEPSPTAISYLRKNAATYKQIQVADIALSDRLGEEEFLAGCGAYVGNSSMNAEYVRSNVRQDMCGFEKVMVKTTTLDQFCSENDIYPNFIKIDVEGAEDRVLAGSLQTLADHGPTIAMEVWFDIRSNARDRSLRLLQDHGYNPYGICDDGKLEELSFDSLDSYWDRVKNEYDFYHGLDNIVFKKK